MSTVQQRKETKTQEEFLRERTKVFRGLAEPLKFGPRVSTFRELINELYRAFETPYVNMDLVNHLLMSYKSNADDWKQFAKWDRVRYTRNLVDAGNGRFNLMILCWNECQGSAIHDHANSHCFMKMLQGTLSETRYEMPENSQDVNCMTADIGILIEKDAANDSEKLKEISKQILELDSVYYINDNIGLHRVENLSPVERAVSLHLYCPPFDRCSVYQENSAQKASCDVTFYSIKGCKIHSTKD